MATTIFADPRSAVHENREFVFGEPRPRPSDKYSRLQNLAQNIPILGALVPRSRPEPFERLNPHEIAANPDPGVQERWNSLTPAQKAQMVLSRPSGYIKADRGERRAMLGLAPIEGTDAEMSQLIQSGAVNEEELNARYRRAADAKHRAITEGEKLTGVAPKSVELRKGDKKVTIPDVQTTAGKARHSRLLADDWEIVQPLQRRAQGLPSDFTDPTTATRTAMQTEVRDASKKRDRMLRMLATYNPDLQTLKSKFGANLIGWRATMEGIVPGEVPLIGGRKATPEEEKFVHSVRTQHQELAASFAEDAHALYGAALTAVELPRAEAAIPNPNLNPVELKASMETSMRIADYAITKISVWEDARNEPNGPDGPHEMDLIDVGQFLSKRANEAYDQVLGENPSMSEDAAYDRAIQRVEDRYNITPGGYVPIVQGTLDWLAREQEGG